MALIDQINSLATRIAQEISKRGVPKGGAAGTVLTKSSASDFTGLYWASLAGDLAWTAPAYSNGFGAYTGLAPGYRKDAFGYVRFHGLMTIPNSNTTATAFTLPTGYRPAFDQRFSLISNEQFANFVITSAGVGRLISSNSNFVDLSGIQFLAEQ